MLDALPGPRTGWKPFTHLCLLFALGEPCAGLQLLTGTHMEGKGERLTEEQKITLQISQKAQANANLSEMGKKITQNKENKQ